MSQLEFRRSKQNIAIYIAIGWNNVCEKVVNTLVYSCSVEPLSINKFQVSLTLLYIL